MSGARALVVGPFPPPVHGAAVITAEIARLIAARAVLRRCDISPGRLTRGAAYHMRRVARVLAAAGAVVASAGRAGCVYISVAGGHGLAYNLFIAAVARLLLHRLVLHHHSFAYLDRPSRIMRLLARVAGARATHVALCQRMADRLREAYGVRRILCVSNAAFYPPAAGRQPTATGPELRLGHMGNLADEKGLDLVLALHRDVVASGIAARLVLAGPAADAAAEQAIAAARAASDDIDYRGPVYGAEKDRFFADIDLFLFPTRYFNEAEPTVLFEAMAHGVPIIAYGRGCIAEQIGEGAEAAGIVVPVDDPFVARGIAELKHLAASPERMAALRASARTRMEQLHKAGLEQLEDLLQAMIPRAR